MSNKKLLVLIVALLMLAGCATNSDSIGSYQTEVGPISIHVRNLEDCQDSHYKDPTVGWPQGRLCFYAAEELAQSPAKISALEFFKRACSLGTFYCNGYYRFAQTTKEIPDTEKVLAKQLAIKGCLVGGVSERSGIVSDHDWGAACKNIGHSAIGDDRSKPQDKEFARLMLRKACDLGYFPACEDLKYLGEDIDLAAASEREKDRRAEVHQQIVERQAADQQREQDRKQDREDTLNAIQAAGSAITASTAVAADNYRRTVDNANQAVRDAQENRDRRPLGA